LEGYYVQPNQQNYILVQSTQATNMSTEDDEEEEYDDDSDDNGSDDDDDEF
jgi:hypothetical protein